MNLNKFKNKIFTNSGTSALITILEYLKSIRKRKIAIPAYCHVSAVTKCIQDFEIIIIDTESSKPTMSLEELKKYDVDIVLFSEINGYLGDIKNIAEYCNNNKIILIEDCAPSILQTNAGIYGDFAFFSFSSSKYISCDGGGVLISKESEPMEFFEDFIRLGDKKQPFHFITNMYLSEHLKEIILNKMKNFDPKSVYYKNLEAMKSAAVVNDFPGTQGIFIKNHTNLEMKLKLNKIKFKKYPHLLLENKPNAKRFFEEFLLIEKDYNLEKLKKIL